MIKTAYEYKKRILSKDTELLEKIIKMANPELNVSNNHDRTIRVEYGNIDINSVTDCINNSVDKWIGEKSLPISPYLIYGLFPLNNTTCLIKI